MNFPIISILIPCLHIQPDHFLRENKESLVQWKDQKFWKSDCCILTWESFEELINLSNLSFSTIKEEEYFHGIVVRTAVFSKPAWTETIESFVKKTDSQAPALESSFH